MESKEDYIIDSSIRTICAFITPFIIKWVAVLDNSIYAYILGASILSIIVLLIYSNRKQHNENKKIVILSSFSLALALCIFIDFPKSEAELIKIKIDNTERIKLEKEAKKHNVTAMEKVGVYYFTSGNGGDIIPRNGSTLAEYDVFDYRDFEKAKEYLELAAEHDSDVGYCLLGVMKIEGLGCVPMRRLAIRDFEKVLELNKNNTNFVHNAVINYGITEEEFPLAYEFFPDL